MTPTSCRTSDEPITLNPQPAVLAAATKVGVPVISAVAVIRLYVSPDTSVPVTETFEPVAKSIVPPVVQGLSKATSTVPPFCTCRLVIVPRVVVDPLV